MPAPADQALELYIQSVEAEAKAEVCSRHVSSFVAEFERRYKAWHEANAAALVEGAKEAVARGVPVQRFAGMRASLLEQLPEDDRERRCGELLLELFLEEGKK